MRICFGLLLTGLLMGSVSLSHAAPKTPVEWLGYELGADGELADWETIVSYCYHLSAESERAEVLELGQSTLGRPFLLVVLSDEDGVAQMDRYQDLVRRLYRVDHTDDAAAHRIANEGKVLVALSLGLHSIEVGASQASMEIMYRLVSAEDETTRAIRENCLVLLVPSMNPDGLDIVVDWYRESKGTPAEGTRPPWLYHHYAGHDNNRDGFFNNLRETTLWSRVLYDDWLPQIILDEHQMGSRGPRLFLPPFDDPVSPTVHRLVYTQLSAAGQQMVSDLTAKGWTGIATSTIFTAEWPGSVRSTGFWHNMLGILSEVASARLASPLLVPPGSLTGGGRGLPSYERRANFLEPWPGGWWRLGDIVDLEVDLTWALLSWAARERENLLYNFYSMNAEAVQRGREESPFGYLVGVDQHDLGAAHRLAEILLGGGVELSWVEGPFELEGRVHDQGAYLIRCDQPFRPFVVEMLDPPHYPMIRESQGGELIQPYDVTAWSLPDLLDIEVQALTQPAPRSLGTRVPRPQRPRSSKPEGITLLSGRDNASYEAVVRLLAEGVEVRRFSEEQEGLRVGDFVVESDEAVDAILMASGARPIAGKDVQLADAQLSLRTPKVALYAPWGGSMDEGWTRLVLDRYGFAHARLRADDLARAAEREDGGAKLRSEHDVILIPSISKQRLRSGRQPDEPTDRHRPMWPAEYRGGLASFAAGRVLGDFAEAGGTVIALGASCSFVAEELGLPVVVELEERPHSEFHAPGTLVHAELDPRHPLAWGEPDELAIYLPGGRTLRPLPWSRRTEVPVLFAKENLRASGFLVGEELMAGRPALLDLPLGEGRVVLFAFAPQHRAQTEATFKLLFNALLRAAYPSGSSHEE